MRLLHIIRTLSPVWGGPVTGLNQMASAMSKLGTAVEILCLDDPKSPWLAKWAPPIHAIGPGLGRYGYHPALKPWLERECTRFDAVVINGIWMYHSVAAHDVLTAKGIPYSVFIHGALHPWFKQAHPLKHIKKTVYWKLFEHRVLRDAATVVFTTQEEQRLAENAFQPYRCKPVVVGYGINEQDLGDAAAMQKEFRSTFPALGDRPYLLFLGRINEVKALDVLLPAIAAAKEKMAGRVLVLAGAGANGLIKQLKKLSADLQIEDRILWTGAIYDRLKWGALMGAEALVLPSHLENFGLSAAEALSCNVPILISDKVNIWQDIQDGDAGLVAPDTVEGFSKLLAHWFDLFSVETVVDAAEREELFLRAFQHGEQRAPPDTGFGKSLKAVPSGSRAEMFQC